VFTLQNFEVLQICIFGVDIEFDSGHGYVEEDAVEYLAESSSVVLLARNRLKGCGGKGSTYPVPHCSTLVMLSCNKLLSHCISSCL
jgi:hypothetical protein